MVRIVNEKIIILVDSQAAILAIQNNIVKSNTVLTCIKNLNILGKDNDVTIAWTPGHTGIQGNEKADILAESGSALNCSGPEPFISIPYASCRAAIKDWSVKSDVGYATLRTYDVKPRHFAQESREQSQGDSQNNTME